MHSREHKQSIFGVVLGAAVPDFGVQLGRFPSARLFNMNPTASARIPSSKLDGHQRSRCSPYGAAVFLF